MSSSQSAFNWTQEARGEFSLVHQPHGDYWLHSGGRCFITRYEATDARPEHWQAYMAKAQPPAGRYPWTVDNRRLTHERGARSFEEAAQAMEIA